METHCLLFIRGKIFTIWNREGAIKQALKAFCWIPPLSHLIYHCKGDIYNCRTLYIEGSCLLSPFAEIMTLWVVDCCYLWWQPYLHGSDSSLQSWRYTVLMKLTSAPIMWERRREFKTSKGKKTRQNYFYRRINRHRQGLYIHHMYTHTHTHKRNTHMHTHSFETQHKETERHIWLKKSNQ